VCEYQNFLAHFTGYQIAGYTRWWLCVWCECSVLWLLLC